MHLTVKICFFDIFDSMVPLTFINYHFDCYDFEICFIINIWISNGQNYSLALETCNDDDVQCNAS